MMEKQLINAWLRSDCYIKTVRLCYLGDLLGSQTMPLKSFIWPKNLPINAWLKSDCNIETLRLSTVLSQTETYLGVNPCLWNALFGPKVQAVNNSRLHTCSRFFHEGCGNRLKMEASWLPEWLLAGSKKNWHNQVKAILWRNIHLLPFSILSSEGYIM